MGAVTNYKAAERSKQRWWFATGTMRSGTESDVVTVATVLLER